LAFNPKFALADTSSALVIGSTGTEVKPFAFAVRFVHNASVSTLQRQSNLPLLNGSHPPGAPVFSSNTPATKHQRI